MNEIETIKANLATELENEKGASHKERLSMEVNHLRSTILRLGDCTSHITDVEFSVKTKSAVSAMEWERLLDNVFNLVDDFATNHGIETD